MNHKHSRRWASLKIATASLFAALLITAPAHADFNYSQPVTNQKDESFCMGISGNSKASGAFAHLFKCDPGHGNHQFRFEGTIHGARMVNNNSKLCLRVKENSFDNGAQVVQGSCTSVSASWRLVNLQGPGGLVSRMASIQNIHNGRCIGYSGGVVFHGAELKTYGCGNTPYGNQNWVVNPNYRPMPF
jgi:Ricin-type beta-trefoil lectin domain